MNKAVATNLLIFGTLITVIGIIAYKNYQVIQKDIKENW